MAISQAKNEHSYTVPELCQSIHVHRQKLAFDRISDPQIAKSCSPDMQCQFHPTIWSNVSGNHFLKKHVHDVGAILNRLGQRSSAVETHAARHGSLHVDSPHGTLHAVQSSTDCRLHD